MDDGVEAVVVVDVAGVFSNWVDSLQIREIQRRRRVWVGLRGVYGSGGCDCGGRDEGICRQCGGGRWRRLTLFHASLASAYASVC